MNFMPNYQQPYYPQYQAPQAMPDDRIWVQGEVGAKAYLVAPGNTVTLWDSEKQAIYRKTVNAQGVPMIQKLVYSYDEDTEASSFDKRLKGIEDRLTRLEGGNDQ